MLMKQYFKAANLQDFDTMFQEDTLENELSKLKALVAVREAYDEHREKCREFMQIFITQMLTHHQSKEKEKIQFKVACEKVQKRNDERCLAIISEFNSKKKKVKRVSRSAQFSGYQRGQIVEEFPGSSKETG